MATKIFNHTEMDASYCVGDSARRGEYLDFIGKCAWGSLDYKSALESGVKLFPALERYSPHILDVVKVGINPHKVPAALFELDDTDSALFFLSNIAKATPDGINLSENDFVPLSETLIHVSAYFQKKLSAISVDWMSSRHKDELSRVIAAIDDLQVPFEGFSNPVVSPTVASLCYKAGDLDNFIRLTESRHFRNPNPGTFIVELGDIWKLGLAGNSAAQRCLIDVLASNIDNLGQVNKDKAIVSFWNGHRTYLESLKNSDKEDVSKALDQALKTFNFDSLQSQKQLLATKQLFKMPLGIARFAEFACSKGVELSIDQVKEVIQPISSFAKLAGRKWVSYMGRDFEDMKSSLSIVFKDIEPSDLSSRPLPKHLASILSEVLDDTKWIGKATIRDRGRILSDDLGI